MYRNYEIKLAVILHETTKSKLERTWTAVLL